MDCSSALKELPLAARSVNGTTWRAAPLSRKHILTKLDRSLPTCPPGPGPASTRSMNDKELASSRFETEALGKRVARLIAESHKLVATCRGLQESIQPGRRSRSSVPTIKPDHTGCLHLHLHSPVRKTGDFEVDRCSDCGNQVILKLDDSGERTGQSWLLTIELIPSTSL